MTFYLPGRDDLAVALDRASKLNERVAKNVIIFVGDGMNIPTVTATRQDGRHRPVGNLVVFFVKLEKTG